MVLTAKPLAVRVHLVTNSELIKGECTKWSHVTAPTCNNTPYTDTLYASSDHFTHGSSHSSMLAHHPTRPGLWRGQCNSQ